MISFLSPFIVLAASAYLALGQLPTTIPVGKEFKLPINVSSGGRETIGTDAVIQFDPKVLAVTKVNPGKAYSVYPPTLVDIDNVHGKVSFSGTAGFQTPKIAEGLFGEVFFRPKKPGMTKIDLVWEPKATNESNIVPASGGLDLLTEAPRGISLSIKEASSGERIWFLIKQILSFNYLRF